MAIAGKADFDEWGRKAGNMFLNAIFPPACPVCGKPAPFKDGIRLDTCTACRKKLKYIKTPYCLKCGKELDDDTKEYCYDCVRRKHYYDSGRAVFLYNDAIKKSIYRYKYKNKREYASFYANEIIRQCKDTVMRWNPQVLIPIPLHPKRYRKRGYNQAELIAARLGNILNIPVDTQLLIRIRNTTPMKELSDTERINNLENAFKITSNVVKYKKIVLIDDIYTTGSTIDKCAKILKANGAKQVNFICLCIGKGTM